jgi:phage baseplate assembly protein W
MISTENKSEIYADFNVDMEKDPRTSDILKDVNVETLKTSIRNILLTHKGTRRMQPEFGADLESKVFEPITQQTGEDIGNLILNQVELWDPDIYMQQVSVTVDEEKLRYDISIKFTTKTATIASATIKFVLDQR